MLHLLVLMFDWLENCYYLLLWIGCDCGFVTSIWEWSQVHWLMSISCLLKLKGGMEISIRCIPLPFQFITISSLWCYKRKITVTVTDMQHRSCKMSLFLWLTKPTLLLIDLTAFNIEQLNRKWKIMPGSFWSKARQLLCSTWCLWEQWILFFCLYWSSVLGEFLEARRVISKVISL